MSSDARRMNSASVQGSEGTIPSASHCFRAAASMEFADREVDGLGDRDAERDGGPEDGDLPLIARHDRGLARELARLDLPPSATLATSVSFDWYWAQRVTSSERPSV